MENKEYRTFSEYSGMLSLILSLLSLAYMFGVMNTTLEHKVTEKQVLDLSKDLIEKERALSNKTYYVKPKVENDFVSKEEFRAFIKSTDDKIRLIVIDEEGHFIDRLYKISNSDNVKGK